MILNQVYLKGLLLKTKDINEIKDIAEEFIDFFTYVGSSLA